jgi:hypothetical protein
MHLKEMKKLIKEKTWTMIKKIKKLFRKVDFKKNLNYLNPETTFIRKEEEIKKSFENKNSIFLKK